MSPTILTATGHSFNLLEPNVSAINIADIAHSLAHLCRFTGHTKAFYSVAEHSYHCSYLVPPQDALCALLHDATEAYLGDVASPLKRLLPDYKVLEERAWFAIATCYLLPLEMPSTVKEADMLMLRTERRDLMPHTNEVWADIEGVAPASFTITPLHPEVAKYKFLSRFVELWPHHLFTNRPKETLHV